MAAKGQLAKDYVENKIREGYRYKYTQLIDRNHHADNSVLNGIIIAKP